MPTTLTSCQTTSCAFNQDGCTAYAVTIGGSDNEATCGTFIELDARGGLPTAEGHVGACKRFDCKHNESLMCSADAITVGGNTANCLSYEAR